MPARSPLVTHILVPLMTYSSPSGVALHRRARVSLPASGSLSDRDPRSSPVTMRGGSRCPLLVGAVVGDQRGGDDVGVQDAGERHPPGGELLDDAGVGRDVEAEAAVLRGDRDAEQPHGLHLLDKLFGVGVGVLELGGDRQHLFGDERPDGVDELVGEGFVEHGHGRDRTTKARGAP